MQHKNAYPNLVQLDVVLDPVVQVPHLLVNYASSSVHPLDLARFVPLLDTHGIPVLHAALKKRACVSEAGGLEGGVFARVGGQNRISYQFVRFWLTLLFTISLGYTAHQVTHYRHKRIVPVPILAKWCCRVCTCTTGQGAAAVL